MENGWHTHVLITGASSGIGAATARVFAEPGVALTLLARGQDGLRRTAEATEAEGAKACVAVADVRNREALESSIDCAIDEHGPIDIAVVNAGAAAYGTFTATDPVDFDRTVETTLLGAANTIRLVLPSLERTGGSLVVVGSVAGQIPLPMLAGYSAAKHGLRGLVDALQVELGESGSNVAVSLVSPGPVDTPFWHNVATQEGHLPPEIPGAYPPEDVATAIADCARNRRRGRTIGGMMLVAEVTHSALRPISEMMLRALTGWARSAGERGPGERAIDGAAGTGELRAGLISRRSKMMRAIAVAEGAGRRVGIGS